MKKPAAIIVALLLGLVLAGCVSDPTTPSTQLQQRIEAARTPMDHESLSKYYEAQAATAREHAGDHRRLARIYQAAAVRGQGGTPNGQGGTANAPAYHNALAQQDESSATAYDGLAAEHRNMAKAAKP